MIPLSVPYLNFILVSDIPNRIFDLHYICFPFTMRCNVGKKRKHRIIVFGWDWIDFMVMASGTSNGHTEKYFGGGAYNIVQVIIAGEHPVGWFIVPKYHGARRVFALRRRKVLGHIREPWVSRGVQV